MYRQTNHRPLSAEQCFTVYEQLPEVFRAPMPGSTGSYIGQTDFGDFIAAHLGLTGYLRPQAVVLHPSQQIQGHSDKFTIPTLRLHVPIHTNDDCWCFHDGVWQRLTLGCVYAMDPGKPHGAVNWGTAPRVHFFYELEGVRA